MKNNESRGSNKLHSTLARAVRLLEYLRKNTDKENTISQSKLLEAGGDDHIFGAKKTLKKTIVALAEALNTDKYGRLKPKEDWRLSYKAFDKYYDENGDDDDEMSVDVVNIYYNHVFSDDELTSIINALYTTKAVNKAQAEVIVGKLVKNFATENYKPPAYNLDFSEFTDSLPNKEPALLSKNIAVIQKAISEGFRVSFDYNRIYSSPNGYDGIKGRSDDKLMIYGDRVLYVSPHYIVCEKGRLFMYGGFENGKTCVLRIDLMTNICLAGKGKSTRPSLDKLSVRLPEEMTDGFKVRHLYSSYENDWATVEFEWSCCDEKTGEFICTALYGAFGNGFMIDGCGNVTVQTSKFGMKIFAFQYAEYVKVIRPVDLANDIAESVRGLRDKYL